MIIPVEIVRGNLDGKLALIIGERRVAGFKPLGGGTVILSFRVDIETLMDAIEEYRQEERC